MILIVCRSEEGRIERDATQKRTYIASGAEYPSERVLQGNFDQKLSDIDPSGWSSGAETSPHLFAL